MHNHFFLQCDLYDIQEPSFSHHYIKQKKVNHQWIQIQVSWLGRCLYTV